MTIFQDIFPPSLALTQENDQLDEANVFDMQVRKEGGNITKDFCKTDQAFIFCRSGKRRFSEREEMCRKISVEKEEKEERKEQKQNRRKKKERKKERK